MSDTARARAGIAAGFIAALPVALAACTANVSVGTKSISPTDLQTEVQSELSKTVGQEAPPISCPEPLEAKVGATTTCTMTESETTYNVSVKVTAVDGDNARFDIKVADQPNP